MMKIIRSNSFKKITIIGVGLMGGSLGMAIKKRKLAREVIGVSQKQSSLVEAIKLKAIDRGETNLQKAVKNADLVILATPVELIIKLIKTINPYLRRGCLVTDIGSAKLEVVETAQKKLSNPGFFVGSHPLVGSEKRGVGFADADLYEQSECIITPTKHTSRSARDRIRNFWSKIGCHVKSMSPEEHDQILAYTSHLPHLLAYGLMETIPPKYLTHVSNGFKDTTRIASSSPQMWNDICLANSNNLIHSLDDMVKNLAELRKAIVNRDEKTLMNHFTKAKEKRDDIKEGK